MAKSVLRSKKGFKNIAIGIMHVKSSFNNIIITITDVGGNALVWSSAGAKGFKGARKSTPFAAQTVAEDAIAKAKEHGIKQLDVIVRGINPVREAAVKVLQMAGIKVNSIADDTPVAHGGCRPAKRRRV